MFHWTLVIAVLVSTYTGLTGGFVEMDIHMMSGYVILGLMLFRLGWGVFGHHYSRFSEFVKGPSSIWRYIGKLIRNENMEEPGHNPLGALSIVVMLVLFLAQASTGLFANDDIMTEGPLTHLVSYDVSRTLTAYHKLNFWLILGMVCLHLCAVAFYMLIRKQSMIKPMITGTKYVADSHPAPAYKRRVVAATSLAILVIVLIVSILRFL